MWFGSVLDRRGSGRSRAARTFGAARLSVEGLEDRSVPSGAGPEHASHDPHDWPMFNHDPAGTRFNQQHTPASAGVFFRPKPADPAPQRPARPSAAR